MAERFAVLLELFRRHEDEARRRIGALERERAAHAERLARLAAERVSAAAAAPLALREQLGRYWARVGAEMQTAESAIKNVDRAIAEARQAFAEAHRRLATFEKLRERDRRVAARAAERRDARRLDEFAARRAGNGALALTPSEVRP